MDGNSTIKNMTMNCTAMKGITPRVTSSMRIRPTPATTLSTVPTGGVTKPMELLMMNNTPKYTGSMPAALTMGINTGVKIRMVGVMSIAVPTIMHSSMMAAINNVGLPNKGSSKLTTCAGKLATVINQADTIAAATKNMITDVVLAAMRNTSNNCDHVSSR